MELPEKVVADTSALYAIVAVDDRFHNSATEYYERLKDRKVELWTTSYALSETVGLIHRRIGFNAVLRILEIIEASFSVYWIDEITHSEAVTGLKAADGEGKNLVDWTVLIAARNMYAHIFTYDSDFMNSGVPLIPP